MLGLAEIKQVAVFDQDVQAFAISQDNHVVYAVERMKRIKKLIVEHDDFWVGDVDGKKRKIIDGDKFSPVPFSPDEEPSDPGDSKHPPLPHQHSYQVDTLTWSPDSKRIVVKMDTSELAQPRGSIVQQLDEQQTVRPNTILYLMDADGREISISGSKTATLSDAFNAAWLADGQTLVYLSKTTGGLSQINAMRPADGKKRVLFDGFTFAAVAWDTKRNQAFAIEQNTRLVGPPKIMQLDLAAERVTELGSVEEYAGFLTVAPSAKKIAYFKDGDTLEVRDVVGRARPVVVRVAIGEFQWSRDEQHILLKRGQPTASNNLVWVGVYNGAFEPFFHGLEFHSFAIAPDGATVGVTEPGKRSLVMYRLE
jgi:WD40-like Beta Propeller Repeat